MEIATKIAPIGLALIMLGLGMSLTIKDFLRVIKTPKDFKYDTQVKDTTKEFELLRKVQTKRVRYSPLS